MFGSVKNHSTCPRDPPRICGDRSITDIRARTEKILDREQEREFMLWLGADGILSLELVTADVKGSNRSEVGKKSIAVRFHPQLA